MKTSDMTTRERVAAGDLPNRFWINSLGEFGHEWPDGSDSCCGTVNIADAVRTYGQPEHEAIKRAFEAELFQEIVDPRELLLYRSWEALMPLEGAGFRFAATFTDGTPHLYMTIEYVLDDDSTLRSVVNQFSKYNATHEKMWDDLEGGPGAQYCVTIPGLFGISFAEVALIQYNWLTIAASARLAEGKVNIL